MPAHLTPGPVTASIEARLEQFGELLGAPCDISLLSIARKHAMPFERVKDTLDRLALHEALIASEGRQDIAAKELREERDAVVYRLRRKYAPRKAKGAA